MNGINRVFIMGYLGHDPEMQSSKTGKSYVRLSVSTHFNKKLLSGDKERTTVWHRVTVWGKNAEKCQDYLQKGSPLAVEGYLSNYKYEKDDGTDAHGTSIVAREIHFIGSKSPEAIPDFQRDDASSPS